MLKYAINQRRFFLLLLGALVTGCQTARFQTAEDASLFATQYAAPDLLASSLPELIAQLNSGKTTSFELVSSYMKRIEQLDRKGPNLRSIITLNPEAISIAERMDSLRRQGKVLGPLHGVPILLKDNIESKDNMPTTAGALALSNNFTDRDSPLVAGLRAQGAIILGKTNLSQWANFRSESSMSGWSALAGQVRNPHMLDRNPCGSSSGSGSATAASLAAASVGTETNGSIICPANANGIVGFKPTVGVIPQTHIIPISKTQDTAGPMTKTVKGAAIMMNAMAGNSTRIDYLSGLDKKSLSGVRVGVLKFAQGSSKPIIDLFNQSLADLKSAGAILVEIEKGPQLSKEYWSKSYDLLKYEFKHGLNQYLASTDSAKVIVRDLAQLIQFNQTNHSSELALFDQSIFIASQALGSLEDEQYQSARALVPSASKKTIDDLMESYNVSVLVAPSGPIIPRIDPINGDVWPNDWPGAGTYAARAGYPHITVPMGGVNHLPVGLSFIGSHNQDARILSFAFAYEQISKRKLNPNYFKTAEDVPSINRAMSGIKE
jgi:amidase